MKGMVIDIIKWIKNEWNKHGCLYRTVRTFIQAFVGTVSGYLTQMASGNVTLSAVIGVSLATGLCAIMNIDYSGEEGEKDAL